MKPDQEHCGRLAPHGWYILEKLSRDLNEIQDSLKHDRVDVVMFSLVGESQTGGQNFKIMGLKQK